MGRFNKNEQVQPDEGSFRSDMPVEQGKSMSKEEVKEFKKHTHDDPGVLGKFKTPGFEDIRA